ncbi:hypothetical protein OOZ15_17900 [Galbibacter sp. EGI 63066]|uniref:hypothetical protein n=1 Tax=Galbibacter sp. EGI 63066 TaxID=2993559 RepID=UPI0022492EB9|nr:hypothetical protein [Galbibacter sp. EGI 63066]MCX2681833.1 hypothetical protein [Galbibacter sp. EGI 63066]
MYILFPGRHHLLTAFQFEYIKNLINTGFKNIKNVEGNIISDKQPIDGIIFAVTSANHSGTKRNPIPFYLRAMMVHEFCSEFDVPSYVYGIDDVGILNDFASYTLKQIKHQSEYNINLTPDNTFVVCSTPVLHMYQKLGFTILPAELIDIKTWEYQTNLPWEVVDQIVNNDNGLDDKNLSGTIHHSSRKIWTTYSLYQKVRNILSDPIIGDDGDITASRDYNTYVRQMDEIAEIKYKETSPYIIPGRVGDIGCAVGSWIKQASENPKLRESDFYGIEVARQLFDICNQRKHNGEFSNPNVFFSQKNAVSDLVFEKESMHTIHTSSLTHEIESYGDREDLLRFIKNRCEELISGGVWINRDVIGPENGEREVLMLLNKEDGENEDPYKKCTTKEAFKDYLDRMSTFTRFLRFASDFRKEEHDTISYSIKTFNDKDYISIKLKDATEFMLTKDYTDNWLSEMHERFCFWSLEDWKKELDKAGFQVDENTRAYTNPWIEENRFKNKVQLFDTTLRPLESPYTNALIIARKV